MSVSTVKSKEQICLVTPNSMARICKYLISLSPENKLCTFRGINTFRPVDLTECTDTRILNEPILIGNLTLASRCSQHSHRNGSHRREIGLRDFDSLILEIVHKFSDVPCTVVGVGQTYFETYQTSPYFPNEVSWN